MHKSGFPLLTGVMWHSVTGSLTSRPPWLILQSLRFSKLSKSSGSLFISPACQSSVPGSIIASTPQSHARETLTQIGAESVLPATAMAWLISLKGLIWLFFVVDLYDVQFHPLIASNWFNLMLDVHFMSVPMRWRETRSLNLLRANWPSGTLRYNLFSGLLQSHLSFLSHFVLLFLLCPSTLFPNDPFLRTSSNWAISALPALTSPPASSLRRAI